MLRWTTVRRFLRCWYQLYLKSQSWINTSDVGTESSFRWKGSGCIFVFAIGGLVDKDRYACWSLSWKKISENQKHREKETVFSSTLKIGRWFKDLTVKWLCKLTWHKEEWKDHTPPKRTQILKRRGKTLNKVQSH